MGRLEKEANSDFRKVVLGHELSELGDAQLYPLLYINGAHVKMLNAQGLITDEVASGLIKELKKLKSEGLKNLDMEHTEDIYFAVEKRLIDVLGIKNAGNIHIGRSRNDIYSTIYRLIIREKLLEIDEAMTKFQATLLKVAKEEKNTIMPGYTHTQHAQAVTLGYYLLAFYEKFERNIIRIRQAFDMVNRSPMGAAAITTTSFNLDRESVCKMLEFDEFIYNAYDAIAGREYVSDVAMALNCAACDLSSITADLMAWNMSEFAFMEFPDDYAIISSIMPQKKNPSALEFLRSAASWVLGDTVAAISSPKGITYADIRDNTKYNYTPLWHAFEVLKNMILLIDEILPLIKWDRKRMYKLCAENYATMTDLADHMVQNQKITFREAHSIVANFVKLSLKQGKKADELSADNLNKVIKESGFDFTLSQAELDESIDPKSCIDRRKVAGGPCKEQMEIMFEADEKTLNKELEWLAEKEAAIARLEENTL